MKPSRDILVIDLLQNSLYDESGVMCYTYGNMGEVTQETRIYALPFLSSPVALSTQFTYDSWGRILNITYPDNEVVNYAYDLGGQLCKIDNSAYYTYLDNVTYDRFGAKVSQTYGNGLVTDYTYENLTCRLSQISVTDNSSNPYSDIQYGYDPVGNVIQTNSNCPWYPAQGFMEIFTYDASDQLTAATEMQNQSYSLSVTYGNWGKITSYSLAQTDLQNNTTQSETQAYTYPAANSIGGSQSLFAPASRSIQKPGQPHSVQTFTFGINGSLRKREVQAQASNTEYYLFNSAANMKAYSNNGLDFAYYGYNAANTRAYKLSMLNQNQWVNGQPEPIHLQLQSAMFYPNAYVNFNHNGEYTKHYYNGSERIASRLGENTVSIAANSNDRLGFRIMQADQQARADLLEVVEAGDIPIETPSVDVSALQTTGSTTDIYYYHTNHLGSTAFVTDQNQTVTQGFLYAPFGEITTEYNSTFGNDIIPKYSFNAKELDEETGMYYYEARYYKPPVFTSRDPMFEKYFWMTPYAYCANNPVKYVDPSGKEVSTHTDENGKVIKVYNDGNIGIYKHSKDEIKAFKNGQEFSNDVENLVGYTLHENSFKENDKIDFGSYVAKEWMKYFELWANNACIGQKDGIFKYGIMAVNGGIFDPKSRLKNGSQISDMVYFSPRDLGNYAAGYIGKKLGFSKTEILARYGAFELSGNNMKKLIGSYKELYLKALAYPPSSSGQRTYGEAPISNFFQRLGYEGINSIDDYIKRYSDIWKD